MVVILSFDIMELFKRVSGFALSVGVQTSYRWNVAKIIRDRALGIDLSFLLFLFKGR